MKRSELLRRMRKSKFFIIGTIIAVLVILVAFTSPCLWSMTRYSQT